MILKFWERTHRLIKARKISQEKFAQLVGINYNTFRCWKYNNRMPDAESACDIADALGVSVEYLVRGAGCTAARAAHALRSKIKQEKEKRTIIARIKKLAIKLGEETERI